MIKIKIRSHSVFNLSTKSSSLIHILLICNHICSNPSSGLHWACKLGRLDMVHVLIAADSDINARAFNGMTPLHMAAQCGYDNIIDVLIKESKYF